MLKSLIRTIPNYPKDGINFRDITTLLQNGTGYKYMTDQLITRYSSQKIDKIAAIEARGFLVAAPLAYALGVGLVPVRKKGKLPAATFQQSYDLEYGQDIIEIHQDAINKGERVLLIDDLIATGGTAMASASLLNLLGANVVELAFVIELVGLGGRQKLENQQLNVFSLLQYQET